MFYQGWRMFCQKGVVMSDTGKWILNPVGLVLRDQLIAKLPKALQQSGRQLAEQMKGIEKSRDRIYVDRATISQIKKNKPVRRSSLERFFSGLARLLNQDNSGFDLDIHADPLEYVASEADELSEQHELKVCPSAEVGDLVPKLILKVIPNLPLYSVLVTLVNPKDAIKPIQSIWQVDGYTRRQLEDVMPEKLSELLRECSHIHRNRMALKKLTIEWYLPIELMGLDVEHWTFPLGDEHWPNGAHCQAVYLRSYERQFDYRYETTHGEWDDLWERNRSRPCHEGLTEINDCNFTLAAAHSGCWFVAPDESSQQEELWKALLVNAVPIALWGRQASRRDEGMAAIDSLKYWDVDQLPAALAEARRDALSPRRGDTMTVVQSGIANLALLWDDPTSLFPSGIEFHSKSA
jgi:hypothetical protein